MNVRLTGDDTPSVNRPPRRAPDTPPAGISVLSGLGSRQRQSLQAVACRRLRLTTRCSTGNSEMHLGVANSVAKKFSEASGPYSGVGSEEVTYQFRPGPVVNHSAIRMQSWPSANRRKYSAQTLRYFRQPSSTGLPARCGGRHASGGRNINARTGPRY